MITLRSRRKSVAEAKLDATKAAAESARAAAEAARTKAVLQAAVLKERFGPQIEQGIASSLTAAGQARQWAAPRVEATAEKVGPAVSAAREKFAEQVWPRVEEALTTAAVAGAAAATQALHKAADAAEAAAEVTSALPDRLHPEDIAPSRGRRGRKVAIALVATGAATAAAVAIRRRATPSDARSWEYVPPLGDSRIDVATAGLDEDDELAALAGEPSANGSGPNASGPIASGPIASGPIGTTPVADAPVAEAPAGEGDPSPGSRDVPDPENSPTSKQAEAAAHEDPAEGQDTGTDASPPQDDATRTTATRRTKRADT